ncbi:MAG: molybdopterin-dependent oxidoreductase [Vicinamibacterales bacterium]
MTLTIDGRQFTVEKGKSVLQAAIENGINVPYYCYHPGIGVDGNCRVCLVKIEKMPKLQVSCSITATEGMVVYTNTPDVIEARAGVFEFLLINHPLDCPVCDKGGECPLQDFSYSFGPKGSRMEFPRRTFDGEGVKADVDFGPTLMLNRNRCILCTRCVRFMKEIDGDAQIGIVDRGYGSEIATFEEQGVHSLLSGNLMDVCPVGAITTRDYRFKSRPWDNPNAVDTTCTLCERGCSTTAWIRSKPEWAKGSQLIRMTPRFDPSNNGYWMCDIGRFQYHWVEEGPRLVQPLVRAKDGLGAVTWDAALAAAAAGLAGSTRWLVSAHASHEELFALARLAQELQGDAARQAVTVTWTSSTKPQPAQTKFQVPAVDAPNVAGARALGLVDASATAPSTEPLRQAVEGGTVETVFVLHPGPTAALGDVQWLVDAKKSGKVRTLIVQAVLESPLTEVADVVLPGATWLEKDAAYTNSQGSIRRASQAVLPIAQAREDWKILAELATVLGKSLGFDSLTALRQELARLAGGAAEFEGLAALGADRPRSARNWLQASNPSERWKWDFLFQDLPPVKFHNLHAAAQSAVSQVIPLKPVE